MISFIRGLVADTTENAVILENNGIGYEIFMTGSSIEQVSRIDGEVLAGLTADELRFAVLSDDIKTISKAPGIGKKTAQKLILELKDKLKLEDAFEKKLAHEQEAASVSGFLIHDGRQEAAEALIALGYSSTDAMKAVRKVTDVSPDDVEALLKAALKQL